MSQIGEEVTKKTKAYAEGIRKQLVELAELFGPKCWALGLLAVEVKAKAVWQILGYDTQEAFRQTLRIGRSTYFRTRRLAEEIAIPLMEKELITRKQLDRLTLENAEQLLRLPERKRFNQAWVTKALTMNEEEFAAAVDQVVENGGEEVESSDSHAILRIHCTQSQKVVIEDTAKRFGRHHGIPEDEYGRIFELMAAEIASGLLPESEEG